MRVLLDTNFLIDVARFKIDLNDIKDLVSVDRFATLESARGELTKISRRKSWAGMNAKIALKLIEGHDVEILKSKGGVDEAIVELAKSSDFIVATNDTKLRKRLKALRRKTIYLKSKKHLAIG